MDRPIGPNTDFTEILLANRNVHVRYMLSPVRLSVCLSSVVGNTRAPYSADCDFRQYFYGVRYLGHPLTSTENFTEIIPREPLRRGIKRRRGSQV